MKTKKYGFTLIEIITALSIFSVLVSILIIWLNMSSICFIRGMKENNENTRAEDAFSFIENQVQNSFNISVENNILSICIIEKNNNPHLNKVEKIKYSYGDLVVEYRENDIFQCENNIIKDIKNFLVEKYGNAIYITVIFNDGKEYTRCLKGIN